VHEIPLSEQKNSLQEFELFISRMWSKVKKCREIKIASSCLGKSC
jgi:hypothetical protein